MGFACTRVSSGWAQSRVSRCFAWNGSRLLPRPPEGVARYCFHPVCLSVCVCVSVCPADILVFYFSAIRRDIDLKFIHDTYRVVLNSLKKVQSYHKN